jgi:hypothetical protein
MQILDFLTSDKYQEHEINLQNNETFTMTLQYYALQERGFWICRIKYNNIDTGFKKMTIINNFLADEVNLLPFGILIYSENKLDPYFINDFATNRVLVYLLTKEEVNQL